MNAYSETVHNIAISAFYKPLYEHTSRVAAWMGKARECTVQHHQRQAQGEQTMGPDKTIWTMRCRQQEFERFRDE